MTINETAPATATTVMTIEAVTIEAVTIEAVTDQIAAKRQR
jgi:hypothetical protein